MGFHLGHYGTEFFNETLIYSTRAYVQPIGCLGPCVSWWRLRESKNPAKRHSVRLILVTVSKSATMKMKAQKWTMTMILRIASLTVARLQHHVVGDRNTKQGLCLKEATTFWLLGSNRCTKKKQRFLASNQVEIPGLSEWEIKRAHLSSTMLSPSTHI